MLNVLWLLVVNVTYNCLIAEKIKVHSLGFLLLGKLESRVFFLKIFSIACELKFPSFFELFFIYELFFFIFELNNSSIDMIEGRISLFLHFLINLSQIPLKLIFLLIFIKSRLVFLQQFLVNVTQTILNIRHSLRLFGKKLKR